jgi:hypothetical protein
MRVIWIKRCVLLRFLWMCWKAIWLPFLWLCEQLFIKFLDDQFCWLFESSFLIWWRRLVLSKKNHFFKFYTKSRWMNPEITWFSDFIATDGEFHLTRFLITSPLGRPRSPLDPETGFLMPFHQVDFQQKIIKSISRRFCHFTIPNDANLNDVDN